MCTHHQTHLRCIHRGRGLSDVSLAASRQRWGTSLREKGRMRSCCKGAGDVESVHWGRRAPCVISGLAASLRRWSQFLFIPGRMASLRWSRRPSENRYSGCIHPSLPPHTPSAEWGLCEPQIPLNSLKMWSHLFSVLYHGFIACVRFYSSLWPLKKIFPASLGGKSVRTRSVLSARPALLVLVTAGSSGLYEEYSVSPRSSYKLPWKEKPWRVGCGKIHVWCRERDLRFCSKGLADLIWYKRC